MDITYQNHENHCGVCVVNSLVKYYYGNSNFNQILTDANVTDKGLSIFEFESLSFKYGILAETYEINVNELEHLDIKDYFVIVIYNNNNSHFVIAKKINKGIKIFDSAKGEYILDYQQLNKVFANIIIKLDKTKLNNQIKFNKNITSYLNIKLVILIILINIMISSLSICFGLLMNYILDLCVISENIKNLVIICISFITISCLKHLCSHLLTHLLVKHLKTQYYFYKSKLLNNLFNKKSGFFNKVYKNNFFILNTAINTICNFNINAIPNLVANIIIDFVCICILCSNSAYFLISLITLIIFQIFYLIVNLNFQKQNLERNIKNANKISIYSNQYIKNNECYNNCFAYEKLKQNLNNEFNISLRNNVYQSVNSSKLVLISNLFNDFIYITTCFVSMIMIWHNNNISIGKILFIINTQLILSNNILETSNFFSQRFIYKKMHYIYEQFCDVNNINNTSNNLLNKIDNIQEIDHNKTKNLVNGKLYHRNSFYEFTNCLLNRINLENYKIKLNGLDTQNISQNWLNQSVCYFNNEISFLIDQFDYSNLNNQIILNCIKQFNIKIDMTKDFNETIMINCLKLLTCQNKIIIFDKYFNNLPQDYKKFVNEKIINELVKNNFVLINE